MQGVAFADRCFIAVIMMIAIGVIFGGILSFINFGYTVNGLITVVTGVLILFITLPLSIFLAWTHQSSSGDTVGGGGEAPSTRDPPPEYRHTWRKEYIETSPEQIRDELEKTLNQKPPGEAKHGSIPRLWTMDVEFKTSRISLPAVAPSFELNRHSTVSTVSLASAPPLGSSQNRGRSASQWTSVSVGSRGRSGSCALVPDDVDEGLPSYDEVQKW
ncbi:uncharacterized protein LOC135199428 isoform X1 [Macrobrachium nipponense]|uniref:uncharacterized protein LOC135199428 isoform X1 n=1 Tax=Macrobrachium nipponense TaxID=159736 RepID=UPI0030C89D5C